LLILSFFVIYYGCSASSNTSRYGNNNGDQDYSHRTTNRFSSEDDDSDYMVIGHDTVSVSLVDDYQDTENLPEDDEVDISRLMEKYSSGEENNVLRNDYGTPKEKMLMEIIKYLNTPYKYGGNSKKGIDCSAFTQTIYKNILSIDLSRSAKEQFGQGEEIDDENDLQFGDLVFFNTRRGVKPGHVGIYIGDHLFAHASTKRGVTISSLDHTYYHNRFMGGRRVKHEGTF
jgi:cell wall-associated NlpC family hydrolase